MPLPKKLSFKSGAQYTVGEVFSASSSEREELRQLLISSDIFVSKSEAFSTKYPDIYDKYVIPATERNLDIASHWHTDPMDLMCHNGLRCKRA